MDLNFVSLEPVPQTDARQAEFEKALAASHGELAKKNGLTWEQQLVLLRGMTKKTGVLHEAQVTQVRLWPFAVDPELEKCEAKVDLDTHWVRYDWRDSDKVLGWRPNADYQKRLLKLEHCIRFLLGAGWNLSVEMNGVSIFTSGEQASGGPGKTRKRRVKRTSNRRTGRRDTKRRRKR